MNREALSLSLSLIITPFLVFAAGTALAQTEPLPAPTPPPPVAEPSPAPAATVVEPAPTPGAKAVAEKLALPDWLSRVEFGGIAFLNYRFELTDGQDSFNTFDLSRMYFFAIVKPADHVKFRMTIDSPNREATTTVKDGVTTVNKDAGRFDVVLKHAYGELYDVPVKGLSVKFGMHDLPWIPFEEKIWTYRFQGPVFVDREGYLSSTDLGVGVSYVRPSKWVEGHVSLVNGETWSKPEVSRHKDVHGRLTVRPLASDRLLSGLAVNLFGSAGAYAGGDNQSRHRLIPQLAFEHKHAAIAAGYFRAWDPPGKLVAKHPSLASSTDAVVTAQGGSAFGWLDFGLFGVAEGLRVMARVEWLDPDTNLASTGHTREIVGVGYRLNKYVQVLLNGELVQYQANARVAADESRIFFHAAVGF